MNKLWVRLTFAFVLVALISAAAAALFVNRQVDAQFQRYLVQNRVAELGLVEMLQEFYGQRGGWAGVDEVLAQVRVRGMGGGPGFGQGAQGRGGGEVILADAAGRVISPVSRAGAALSDRERDAAVPIVVGGQLVGLTLALMPAANQFGGAALAFLSQINTALVQSAALAAIVGAALGFVLARSVAGPLSELGRAALRVAEGKLGERVRAGGTDEVRELAAAFNDMTGHLQDAERERLKLEQLRRNMVADIAHELRTPLTVMQGNLQAILDDVYPLSKAEVATIYDETAVLRRLVSDLHELSLAEAGQLTLNLTTAPVRPLIERAAQRFRELFESKGIALDVAIAADAPDVRMDVDRATQVLNNLLANALKHTPSGGSVTLSAQADAAGARMAVRDTGTGIGSDDLPHVFDRFWRADRSRAREKGGSGLGLAIARQWVEAMGGRIGADSSPGAGSTFWFTLPR